MKLSKWVVPAVIVLLIVAIATQIAPAMGRSCPESQFMCPGVGCVSGPDKCFPGARGGAGSVFSREGFVSKTCPDKTRSDGPCLLEF